MKNTYYHILVSMLYTTFTEFAPQAEKIKILAAEYAADQRGVLEKLDEISNIKLV